MSYRIREAEGKVDVICDTCGEVYTSTGDANTLILDQLDRAGWTLERGPVIDA